MTASENFLDYLESKIQFAMVEEESINRRHRDLLLLIKQHPELEDDKDLTEELEINRVHLRILRNQIEFWRTALHEARFALFRFRAQPPPPPPPPQAPIIIDDDEESSSDDEESEKEDDEDDNSDDIVLPFKKRFTD